MPSLSVIKTGRCVKLFFSKVQANWRNRIELLILVKNAEKEKKIYS